MQLKVVIMTEGNPNKVPNKLSIARARIRMLKLCNISFLFFKSNQINVVFVVIDIIINRIQYTPAYFNVEQSTESIMIEQFFVIFSIIFSFFYALNNFLNFVFSDLKPIFKL
jgi:hypothetical protein